jgi:hypothetical protein
VYLPVSVEERDGQQTGCVTNAFSNDRPSSMSSFWTFGWTDREFNLMSWSSVMMKTEKAGKLTEKYLWLLVEICGCILKLTNVGLLCGYGSHS